MDSVGHSYIDHSILITAAYFSIDWKTDSFLVKFILNVVCNNYKSIWKGWDTDIYQYRWWDQRHGEWYRVAVCDSWGSGNLHTFRCPYDEKYIVGIFFISLSWTSYVVQFY